MNCSFFGSFSKQMFIDLYVLNSRSYHNLLYVFEIMEKEIINTTRLELNDQTDLTHDLVRDKSSSYLMGLLVEDESKILNHGPCKVSMVDTYESRPLSYCIEKNKEYIEILITTETVGVHVGKKQKVYVDEFQSISEKPMMGFSALTTPTIRFINISNKTKD